MRHDYTDAVATFKKDCLDLFNQDLPFVYTEQLLTDNKASFSWGKHKYELDNPDDFEYFFENLMAPCMAFVLHLCQTYAYSHSHRRLAGGKEQVTCRSTYRTKNARDAHHFSSVEDTTSVFVD